MKCKKCSNDVSEFFEWKFEYGLKKMKVIKCPECGFRQSLGMVDL